MPIPSRWRLLDHDTDTVVAECDDIDGLFTDRVFPVPPVYERYTLLGCTPEGPLRAAVDGTGPAWLGNIYLEGVHAPCSATAECLTCYETGEELLDVRVVGHTEAAGGLLDVELEGHRRDEPNNHNGTIAPAVSGYRLSVWPAPDGSDELLPAGDCRDVAGVFRERPDVWLPGPPVTLLGCRPGLTGLVNAKLAHVRVDGTVHHLYRWVSGNVVATRPSALGNGLVDGLGGWFGGDLFWLHECAGTGDAGATPGFRLIWHDAEIARTHLVPGYDRKAWSVAVTFDDLVDRLTDDGVQVELR
ncbi:hypothetical protein [Dactylosporangium sp. NPDC006015]|uniref:hypothetical protein n=1 Tax=Dactylosporangium sp. NPDC006015 TaxID=3154576 RepID=UPI0033A50E61